MTGGVCVILASCVYSHKTGGVCVILASCIYLHSQLCISAPTYQMLMLYSRPGEQLILMHTKNIINIPVKRFPLE